MILRFAPLLLALPTAASAAELGDPVPEAVAVHLTPDGLDALADVAARLVPERIPLTGIEGEWPCTDDTTDPLAYALADLDAVIEVDRVDLVPSDGALDLAVYATLSSTPADLVVQGSCSVLTDLDETCAVALPTTAIELHLRVELGLQDGGFVATAGDPELSLSPIGNPLSDCLLADAVGAALGQDPDLVTDLLLDLVAPTLEGVGDDLSLALDDVVSQLDVQAEIPLGDTALDLSLVPARVDVDERGVILGLSATIAVPEPSDCVPWQEGIALSGAGWPELGGTAPGTSLAYDAGLLVSRDFVDMVLFSAWASGALCLEVQDLGGASLNTDLLSSLAGDQVGELFPESRPATLVTDPTLPPRVRFEEDGPPIRVELTLGLDAFAELDGRSARLFRSDLEAEIGLDVDLTTDSLALGVVLEDEDLRAYDDGSELLAPGWSPGIASAAGPLVGGFLPDDLLPSITLPYLLGMEVDGVVWLPTEDGTWHGAYVLLDTSGVEAVELQGCSGGDLGCDGEGSGSEVDVGELLGCADDGSSGCEAEGGGSCAVIPLPGPRLWPLGLGLLGVFVRRRRRG